MAFQAQARPSIDPLERERREVERRRERLEERRQRILQAKTRLIGVDTAALSQQVDERRRRDLDERQRDLLFDSAAVSQAATLSHLLARQREAQLTANADVAFFQQTQAAQKRIADAMDAERRQAPERPSAVFLQFAGEDLQARERERQQQVQQREWATAQVRQVEAHEEKERADEADYDAFQQRIRSIQAANEERRAAHQRSATWATRTTNAALAAQRTAVERQRAALEDAQDAKELSYTFYDPFMTEQTRPSDTSFCYKGMSQQQRQDVLDTVHRQQEERRQARERERAEALAYDAEQADYRRRIVLADIERREGEQRKREEVKEERVRQAREKAVHDRYLNKHVYTNPVAESYFEQFNTSCR